MQPLITNQVIYPLPKCSQELSPYLLIFDCQLVKYYKILWYTQVKEKQSFQTEVFQIFQKSKTF